MDIDPKEAAPSETAPASVTEPEIEREEKKETVVGCYKIETVLSNLTLRLFHVSK